MMILKPVEIAGVSLVGIGLGLAARAVGFNPLVSVAVSYVIGVLIGVKRPASGWAGMARRRR